MIIGITILCTDMISITIANNLHANWLLCQTIHD